MDNVDVLDVVEVIEEDDDKAYGNRCCDVLKAKFCGLLTMTEVERIMWHLQMEDRHADKVRSDRFIPPVVSGMDRQRIDGYMLAERKNYEGAEIERKIALFREKHDMEMSEKEKDWHQYVMHGYVESDTVAEYIRLYGTTEQRELLESDNDLPF